MVDRKQTAGGVIDAVLLLQSLGVADLEPAGGTPLLGQGHHGWGQIKAAGGHPPLQSSGDGLASPAADVEKPLTGAQLQGLQRRRDRRRRDRAKQAVVGLGAPLPGGELQAFEGGRQRLRAGDSEGSLPQLREGAPAPAAHTRDSARRQ